MNMDILGAYPSKYLQKTDFPAPRQVIVDTVAMEDVSLESQPTEMKPVLYFKGAPHGMVLNKTNANIMAVLFGSETTVWTGKTVEAFNDVTIQYQGQLTGGIRLRPIPQQAAQVDVAIRQPTENPAPAEGIPGEDAPW
jgi:F0F1-type ATP synthase alpha subunit